MADLTKTIEIIFQGRDKTADAVRNVIRDMGDLGGQVEAVAEPFSNMADYVLTANAALATLAAGGLAASISVAGDFNQQFSEITTLLDGTSESFDSFKADILDYASTSTASFDQVNSAVYSAISAGTDYQDSLQAVEQAEQLAVAGKADLNDTLVLLVSTLNAYGEETDQAQKYADVFFETVRQGQTTIPELASRLAQVSNVAANAGIPIEELTAAIATLTATGLPTAQAITAIRGAVTNIIKPTNMAQEMASKLGIEFNAAALESKGLSGVMLDVKEATGGSTEQMAQLFGSVEGLNGAMILTGESSQTFLENIEAMENSSGAAADAYEKMVNDINIQTQKIKNNVLATLVVVGNQFEEEYVGLADSITGLFQTLQIEVNEGTFDPLFDLVDKGFEELQEFVDKFAELLPEAMDQIDWSGLTGSIENLGETILGFFDIDLSDADSLAEGLQSIVDALETLMDVTTGMAEAFSPYIQAIQDAASGTDALDEATSQAIGNLLGQAKAITTFGAEVVGVFQVMNQAGYDFEQTFQAVAGTIGAFIDGIKIGMDSVVLTVTKTLQALVDMSAQIDSVIPFSPFSDDIDALSQSLENFASGVEQTMNEDLASFGDNLRMIGGDMKDTGEEMDTTGDKARELGQNVEEIPDEKKILFSDEGTLESFKQTLQDAGVEIEGLSEEQILTLVAELEPQSLDDVRTETEDLTEDKDVTIVPHQDSGATESTKAVLDEAFPEKRKMEIELEKERIKAQAETIQTALEMKAKVDVAEAEASLEKFETAIGSINTGIEETGKTLDGLFGLLTESASNPNIWASDVEDWIEDEMERRQQEFDLQEKLINQQVDLLKAKQEAMESGEGLIKIESEGLEPALEMILWEVLKKVQIKASEEASEFLLGLG